MCCSYDGGPPLGVDDGLLSVAGAATTKGLIVANNPSDRGRRSSASTGCLRERSSDKSPFRL
jgi:hypothetical protein